MATKTPDPAAAGNARGPGDASAAPAIASRLRVPLALDPIGRSGAAIAGQLGDMRLQAVSHLFTGMQQVHASLGALLGALADPDAPAQLIGALVQPDGT